MRYLLALVLCLSASGQVIISGGGKVAALVGPRGDTLPSTCSIGQMFVRTGATNPGIYGCGVANTWALMQDGGAGSYTLPVAAADTLGGIKIGSGLVITDGVASVGILNQSTTGNAATATALATARNIFGVSFNGSANIGTRSGNTSEMVTQGAGSKTANAITVYDADGNIVASGCHVTAGVLGCGDGTAQSVVILPELTANGSSDFRIYGAAAMAADGCIIVDGQPGDDQILRATATTSTIDGKTCRLMAWENMPAGTGDVIAPATNTDNYVPQWSGANSKTLKDGLAVATAATANAIAQRNASGEVIAANTVATGKTPLATDGSAANLTNFPASLTTRNYGCAVGDPAGSALSTGVLCYVAVPAACTIVGWDILVDAGTATVDVWKIATGTAIPTDTNTITASAVPAIASGTAIHSTTLTGWTTSVAANDILGFNLDAVATAKYISVTIQCQ